MSEEELVEFLLAFFPETWEGWLGAVMAVSAVLAYVIPAPDENAHKLVKVGHKLLCVMGLGASKIRAAGKIGRIMRKSGGNK